MYYLLQIDLTRDEEAELLYGAAWKPPVTSALAAIRAIKSDPTAAQGADENAPPTADMDVDPDTTNGEGQWSYLGSDS